MSGRGVPLARVLEAMGAVGVSASHQDAFLDAMEGVETVTAQEVIMALKVLRLSVEERLAVKKELERDDVARHNVDINNAPSGTPAGVRAPPPALNSLFSSLRDSGIVTCMPPRARVYV